MEPATEGLSKQSLEWLRDLYGQALTVDDSSRADLSDAASALSALAQHTPAWREPYLAIIDRLGGNDGEWPRPDPADCPQVVDVDFPDVAMTRAEWVDGNLHLRVSVRQPDPNRRTSFRIVGAEPRLWDVHAPDRTMVDVRLSGIHIAMAMVDADIELYRGSY